MGESETKKNVQNAKKIIGLVATSSSISREGCRFGRNVLPAEVILEKSKCSEIEFVKALALVKQSYKSAYDRLKIPRCWDGASHRFFPEAYKENDRILCRVKCDDLMASQFYDLPSEDDRKWKNNAVVYVPSTHPQTIQCLKENKLEWIE